MNGPDHKPSSPRMSDEPVAEFPAWVRSVDNEHRPALLRYAFSICRDYARAEDAVQETFLRLCKESREKLEDRLVPWLFRVCRTRLIDGLRKDGRMSPLEAALSAVTPDEAAPDPAHAAEQRDTHDRVLQCIDRLPPAQREVVRLKFQSHLSYQEIAEVTHKTVNTVGVLLHTAMTSLRHTLSNDAEMGTGEGKTA